MSVHDSYTEVDIHFTKDRSKMRSREVAYESIKNAILRGILAPRERLVEERLGDALQISRTPIREASSILEHEGLIESIPYKGLIVKPVTIDEFLSMYEALGVIEPAIARAAVHNASPADIISMEALLNLATDAIPDDVPATSRHAANSRRNWRLRAQPVPDPDAPEHRRTFRHVLDPFRAGAATGENASLDQ